MRTLHCHDQSARAGQPAVFREVLLGGEFEYTTRSGLSATERALIEYVGRLKSCGRTWILGNRTGALAMTLQTLFPGACEGVLCLEAHHERVIRRNLAQNQMSGLRVECSAYWPDERPADQVFFQLSRGSFSGELAEDFFQQIQQVLVQGGLCVVAMEGAHDRLAHSLKSRFGVCTVQRICADLCLLAVRKTKPAGKLKCFEAGCELTLPGRPPVPLRTIPGVFSHRRVDEGALALAEVVDPRVGDVALDMGCGSGAVGISMAFHHSLAHLTLLDANIRAVWIARKNAEANHLSNVDVVFSDDASELEQRYTLFAGNPPYFADFRIARHFIETARRVLLPGGTAWLVAKHADPHLEWMAEAFQNPQVIRRRGYAVIRAEA